MNGSNASFHCGIPPSLPDDVPEVLSTVQGVIALLTILLSLLLNGLLVFLVVKLKKLHERQFYLALQITVSHIVYSTTVLMTACVTGLAGEWVFGDVVCQLAGPLHDMWVAQRFFFTLVLTLDRCFTLFMPFHYRHYSRRISILMSLTAWFFTINRATVVMKFGLDCYTYVPSFNTCTAVSCNSACQGFILGYSALFIASGTILPFLIYTFIFFKAKQARHSIRRLSITPLGGLEEREKAKQMHSKRNRRALLTIVILLCALVGCTIPPYTIYTVQFALPDDQGPYPILLIFQMLVGRTCLNALTVIDPIVIMRNRDIREAAKTLKSKYFRCLRTVEDKNSVMSTTNGMRFSSIDDVPPGINMEKRESVTTGL